MCERGLKRLQECWECYSDKLTETGVYQPLLSITAKLRRGAKPQLKVLMIVVVCIDWQNSFLQLFKPHKKALSPPPPSPIQMYITINLGQVRDYGLSQLFLTIQTDFLTVPLNEYTCQVLF